MGPCPGEVTVGAFAAGRLRGVGRADVEGHIDGCRDCRQLLVRLLTRTLSSEAADGQSLTLRGSGRVTPSHGPGRRVGRYLIIDDVGAGGMGTVVAAYDTLLDRKVALKFLRSLHAPEAASALMVAEAAAMARLSHPNVVTVHDVAMEGDLPYLAMELVVGVNLAVWRKQAPRSYREIAEVMAAAARGLAAAHAAGIVHRDVKPQNILVAGDRVVVTDFGLSTEMHSGGSKAGTPAYMAPEQVRGDKVDARTDVFGLCATLFEMLHGERPFTEGTPEEAHQQVSSGRVTAALAKSRAPTRLGRLALRGMDPDPARRPQDMAALADELLADPLKRRRNVVLAVAGAAAVTAAFWGGGYLKAHPERRCLAGAEVMAGIWNEGRRAQIAGRFAQAGLGASWPMLGQRLDQYAGGWRATFADTCSATYAKRVQSEEVFDLRMHCLDGQRGIVEAFLLALGSANRTQLVQAAAAHFPAIGDCQFTTRPTTKPRPTDTAARAEIARIEKQLAQSLAEETLGDYPRATATATTALAAARKLGHEPLVAQSLVRLGTVSNLKGGDGPSGGLEQASRYLEEAYTVAEIGLDDRQRLAAAREQMYTQLRLFQMEKAATWVRLGEALLSRLGNPTEEATVIATHGGWVHYHTGRRKEAAVEFRRALDWSRKMSPPDARLAAAAQSGLCHAVRGERGTEEGITCQRKALATALEALSPEHPGVGRYYQNLGYEMLPRRVHLEEACALLRKGIHAWRTLDPGHPNLVAANLNLADCLERRGEYLQARRTVERLMAADLSPVDRVEAKKAYGLLLVAYFDVEEGIRQLRSARDVSRQSEGQGEDVLTLHEILAGIFRDLGRLPEAEQELDAALEIARKQNLKTAVATDLQSYKARLLLAQARYEAAIRQAKKATELLLARGDKEIHLVIVLASEGGALLQLGRIDEAIAAYERGLKAFASAGEFYTPAARADLQAGMARALMQKGGQRARACQLGHEAARYYRPRLGQHLLSRDMERWLSQHRCSPPG
jgi:eukaryotic-like serine/threonine-protein kinase